MSDETENLKITPGHSFKADDEITITMLDKRWFIVLWCWITRKPRRSKEVSFIVTSASYDSVDIKPIAHETFKDPFPAHMWSDDDV